MPCNATSQLTNAPSVPLQVTMPTNNAQWAVFVQRLQAAINATRDAANRQPVNVVPADFAVYNGSTLPALSIIGATSALDTTKHQFGAASLKLTATASTVTVEFSANPILLQPNARWIESVYIQSSRPSIAGTLAIDTPAGSYPVDISGTLLPGTWGRLYGNCDLTADFSTTATMVLTLTGCSVGDTFNLEGWQIEAGTGNLPSPFVNTTVPQTYVDTADNAAEALTNANAAQSSANQANTQLAQVASDGVLSPAEKPIPIRDYSVVTTEQPGIDAQAVAYLGASSAQQVAYDNAITALTNYLNGLTTPTAWNNKSGNTTIVAATFDATWNTVYEKRQILLNAIYQQAQSLANAAQSTANTAQTTGTNAQNTANTANTTATTANANTPTVLNPNFAIGITGWIAAQGWTSDATPRAIYTGFAGASGTLTLANTVNVPCVPGSQIIAQALLSSNAANGACYAGVEFLDSTGAHLAYAFGNTVTGTTAATLSRKVALAPAGSAFARFFLGAANCTSGTYYAQSCLMTVTLSTLDELPDSGSRFAAAQAGADKTSLNTAADTTKVNGVSSSSISPIAALMPQEAGANKTETRTSALTASLSNQTQDALGDGTTYARMKAASLTGNDFDFAKGGVNKHLGNVPDGGSRYAVINGAGLKAVSSVDANNRAGIDFTQSLHIGKTLANMPDDAIGGRFATRVDTFVNRPAAGVQGRLFHAYDQGTNGITYYDTGTAWQQVAVGHLADIQGTTDNVAEGTNKFAGEHGADVTGNHNSATTTKLATARNIAGLAFDGTANIAPTLANIPDDATSTRYAVSNIDGNRRALIDATQAGHVGAWNLDSRVADGTTYARTSTSALTGGNVDLAKAGVVNKNLANIADGGGRYGVHAVDGNNLALIDFSQAGHVNKTIDNVGDGATYLRMPGANMDGNRRGLIDLSQAGHLNKNLDNIADSATYLRTIQQSQEETVDNANFEASTALPPPGWVASGATLRYVGSTNAYEGTQSLRVTTTTQYGAAISVRKYACNVGDVFLVSGAITNFVNTGPALIQLVFFNGSGALVGAASAVSTTNGWGVYSANVTAPAGSVYFQIYLQNNGAAGSDAWYDIIRVVRVRSLDTEVQDGTTYGRTANADLYSSGGVNRIGLRVPGSGQQVGDQRNNRPLVAAGAATAYIASGGTFTETYNSTDNTYSVTQAAMTMQVGSSSVSYNSWTSPHLAPGTKYYFGLNDSAWAGGSPPLIYSTAQTSTLNNDGYVTAGFYTTGASGGGGGGSGGGGIGGGCVALSAFLLPGVPVSRAKSNMMVDGAANFKLQGKVRVTAVQVMTGPCLLVTAADGCAVPVTPSTPFTLPDGTTKLAPDMVGELVLTDLSHSGSKVVSVTPIGSTPYALISRQDHESFAAGVEADKRIYSHNSIK